MAKNIVKVAPGSISNQVDAYNIKHGLVHSNIQHFGLDCDTIKHREFKKIGDRRITSITLGDYGLGGSSFNTQRLASTLTPKVEEILLRNEEIANEQGNEIKTIYINLYPTGTSASAAPIVATASKKIGNDPLIFAVLPENLAESYQHISCIYSMALSSFFSTIISREEFAESVPMDTRIRAREAAGMNPSKFYITAQFSMKLCNRLAQIISGVPYSESKQETKDDEDDLGFLDAEESSTRDMSVELESAIGGRPELFSLYYGHTKGNNFEKLAILHPSVMTTEYPGDPLIFAGYDASLSEDEVGSAIMTGLEMQGLKPERIFFTPSTKNEIIALIPTSIPDRIKDLIRLVQRDKPLKDVMEKLAKKTILSNVYPIRRGFESRIIKERMSQIFYHDKSDVEELAKKQGSSSSWDELVERNLLFYLAEKHGVYLKPIGGDAE